MVEIRAHSPRELQLERKFCGGCQSISRRNVFQERFIWKLIPGSVPTIWKIEPGKQPTPLQGKPCLILSKLQYCVSHEVSFFVEVSYMLSPRHLCDL